jgi:hypothetical protein
MEELPVHQCKNCSSDIEGQYCHFCGQRYHDHKESFGELVYEFVSDFLHFDSRFFKTVLPLIFRPGKLTIDYNNGKQRSQFHPIRLYLFSSFLYFFLFFAFTNLEGKFENEKEQNPATNKTDSSKTIIPKEALKVANQSLPNTPEVKNNLAKLSKADSISDKHEFVTLDDSNAKLAFTVDSYLDSLLRKRATPADYLHQQKKFSNDKKDGYFKRIITIRILNINLKGEEGKREFFNKLTETFLHNIPKMLFFLLPLYAFFLKLLYLRKKQFYYVDHAVLSLHYFSLIFLLLILSNFVLDAIFGTSIFTFLAFVWMSAYMLIAMKRIYGEKWGRTIFKFIALGFLLVFALVFTLMGNMAWTAFMTK